MPLTPEVKLKAAIKKYLEDQGHLVISMYGDGHLPIGFPDIVVIPCKPSDIRGKFCAFEVKVPGKKPRPNQLAWLQHINEAGGFAEWVTSVEKVKECMERWTDLS